MSADAPLMGDLNDGFQADKSRKASGLSPCLPLALFDEGLRAARSFQEEKEDDDFDSSAHAFNLCRLQTLELRRRRSRVSRDRAAIELEHLGEDMSRLDVEHSAMQSLLFAWLPSPPTSDTVNIGWKDCHLVKAPWIIHL